MKLKNMKKIYIILSAVFTGIAYSQSLILTTPSTVSNGLISPSPSTIVNNDTITYCVADLVSTFEDGKVLVINNTAQSMDVKVKRFGTANSCFSSNQICWMVCYAPATSDSPDPVTIAAGDSAHNFHGWMTPDETEGCCFMKYRFYNANDTTQFSDVTLKYCFSSDCASATLGTEDLTNTNMLALYPNPVSDFLTAEFSPIDNVGLISLADITGKVVKTISLGNQVNKQTINIDGLKDGLYIYTLYNNGKMVGTKKVMVKK